MLAGATEISASEGEGQQERRYFVGEGLPDVKSLDVFSRLTGTEGRNPLRNKIIP